jgi:hypothetical protein
VFVRYYETGVVPDTFHCAGSATVRRAPESPQRTASALPRSVGPVVVADLCDRGSDKQVAGAASSKVGEFYRSDHHLETRLGGQMRGSPLILSLHPGNAVGRRVQLRGSPLKVTGRKVSAVTTSTFLGEALDFGV